MTRPTRNTDNDWFFDQFDRNFEKVASKGAKGFLGLGCLAILLNLAFWGSLIVLAAWAIGKWVV